MCLQKYSYKEKIRLKIEHFSLKIGINKPKHRQLLASDAESLVLSFLCLELCSLKNAIVVIKVY